MLLAVGAPGNSAGAGNGDHVGAVLTTRISAAGGYLGPNKLTAAVTSSSCELLEEW
jgi:hypothetical protein